MAMRFLKATAFCLTLLVSATGYSASEDDANAESLLCSPEGLARLMPQFAVDREGQLIVPDPSEDLPRFLSAQQGLSNLITAILARQNSEPQPISRFAKPYPPLQFGAYWLAAEVGIKTSGKRLSPVDERFAFRGESFLSGLEPVSLSGGLYYAIKKTNSRTTYPALVYPVPTVNPCINGLVLAAGDTAGSWPQPTYALGKYRLDAEGKPDPRQPLDAYLIVNICLDLGSAKRGSGGERLTPLSQIVTALHWSCDPKSSSPSCKTRQTAHRH